MRFWRRVAITALAGAMVTVGGLGLGFVKTHAAIDVQSTIEMRQKAMKENAGHMKAINAFLEMGEGDAASVADHAKAIAAAAKHIPEMFPAGTSLADNPGVKTAALPEIWTDRTTFEKAADYLAEQANGLAEVAGKGDKTAIANQFAEVGKGGCGGCHSKFRQKQ
jgi:cytochrome c556